MNYHIDTILLWDSFKAECECPLCLIYEKCERDFVDSALGGSVMEPDRRIEVNKYGFCTRHLSHLYALQNRLGLALMAHSHLREIIAEHKEQTQALAKQLDKPDSGRPFWRRRQGHGGHPHDHGHGDGHTHEESPPSGRGALFQPLDSLCATTQTRSETCFLCNRLDGAMERYLQNTLTMWANDAEFKKTLEGGRGFCMPHYAELLHLSKTALRGKKRAEFLSAITTLQSENLDRMEKELEWYTLKFDYRNKEKPWGTSQDAVERTLRKLRGWSKDPTKKPPQ